MGFFSNILEKLGLKKDKDEEKTAPAAAPATEKKEAPAAKPATASAGASGAKFVERSKDDFIPKGADAVKAMAEVDVVAKLEKMAAGSGLDWKVSIVDLLKVLDIDASKDARIELAKELGCPAELIGGDYSKMNVWLHKAVLKKISENGGNIPASLLD